jgi:hypothetical protein
MVMVVVMMLPFELAMVAEGAPMARKAVRMALRMHDWELSAECMLHRVMQSAQLATACGQNVSYTMQQCAA